jgi:large subunit ribosomal protein L13
MKTFRMRKEDVKRRWYLLDASGLTLGKLAVRTARLLMGKDEPIFTPGVDTGHFVVITNASRVKVTGRKETDKVYRHHTGYIGGFVERPLSEMRSRKPEKILQLAVRRMLPKNKLGRGMVKRLKVYAGPEHPHASQQPEPIGL